MPGPLKAGPESCGVSETGDAAVQGRKNISLRHNAALRTETGSDN